MFRRIQDWRRSRIDRAAWEATPPPCTSRELAERIVAEIWNQPESVARRARVEPMGDAEYIEIEILLSGAVPPRERAA